MSTFEASIQFSFSITAPSSPVRRFGFLFLTIILRRSTFTRPCFRSMSIISPRSPFSFPAKITTVSPFLTCMTFSAQQTRRVSKDLRRQTYDLHVLPRAKFASDRSEDTGSDGLVIVIDQDSGVVVKPDISTVRACKLFGGTYDHGALRSE